MDKTVSIVGAGIGGLVLARILHLHGISATVYEGEPNARARTQGGQLDIHAHDGQLALRDARLTEEFDEIIHHGGEAARILDRHGALLFDAPDDGKKTRPEVLRGDLRRILLESLPEGTVRWGRRVHDVQPAGDGGFSLSFADGTAVRTDVLVGADGAWSRVRPLLSDAQPAYLGTTFVETYLYEADARHPAAAEAVGAGSMFALAPGQAILAHREPGDVLHTYALLNRPADWANSIDFSDAGASVARVAAEFDGWAPELTALITDSDTAPVPRPLYALPDGHRWPRVRGVTLLGDAAHLSAPGGEGANLAMYDAAELGKAIAAAPGDIESAFSAYEEAMFPRSEASAVEARAILQICLGDRAPYGLVDFFTGSPA
jgi:2-polyprenyl-6-methoxyphenol hydroxylase-like FAD-dependent oxidoreductase